jgi:molybdopterin synthase catalytic subunit
MLQKNRDLAMPVFVTTKDFDVSKEVAQLVGTREDIGAVVTFTGLCRREGENSTLTLECYEDMAHEELTRIMQQAKARWNLIEALIIHRYGEFQPADQIMMVATLSSHRKDAFEAAEFLMDYLKTDAPFWKLAAINGKANWVEAKAEDDAAKARWIP